MNPWRYEKRAFKNGFSTIAGIDEAGRGPLAGPVVSAAVILPSHIKIEGINDSKKLSVKKRCQLFEVLYQKAVSIGIGIIDPVEIDRINILKASLLAMAVAVDNLKPQPDFLLIDGKFNIPSPLPQAAIIRGDAKSISIAAASIIAKVSRDRLMEIYDWYYPEYGLAKHKGYPTRAHKQAIQVHGCSPIHRHTFKGVKEFI
jgi:ribonuclease HII